MKRLLLLFFYLLPGLLMADNIPVERAKELAVAFFQANYPQLTTASNLRLVRNGGTVPTRSDETTPAYYVFDNNSGQGFVIVAGDDVAMPILGYSFENNFPEDNLPPNLIDWLEVVEKEINSVRNKPIATSTTHKNRWSAHSTRAGNVVIQLETAKWNQETPYNIQCPTINGAPTYTGCTATAVAIIMRYHKHPERGNGIIPGYTTKTHKKVLSNRTLGHTYDWEKMPLEYHRGSYTQEQANQVAALLFDCGMILQADYGPIPSSGTSAPFTGIVNGLATYMQYDKSARCLKRNNFSTNEWYQLLKTELDNQRPIFYSGFNSNSGHAFVFDGYTDDNYFSVNWGWGGYYNGYFLLSALAPDGQGAGGSGHYNDNQWAVIGLQKDAGGDYVEELRFRMYDKDGTIYNGFSSPNIAFNMEEPFSLTFGFLYNAGESNFIGSILIALTDKDGNIKDKLYQLSVINLPSGSGYNLTRTLTIKVPIQSGDRIRAFYQNERIPEWTLVRGNEETGCIWELIIMPEEETTTIEETTSVTYNNKTHLLRFTVKEGVNAQLLSADDKDLSTLCNTDTPLQISIDTSLLEPGTYTFVLQKGNDCKKLKFKVGAPAV